MGWRKRGADGGAVAVEFGLTIPILMLFLLAIVDFGRAYNAKIMLTEAVREGARTAAFGGGQAEVSARVSLAANLDGVTAVLVKACPADAAHPPPTVTVTASYPFEFWFIPSGGDPMTAQGVMQCQT